jgi:peptidyl-prolyl cis-trans isomerase SurA
MAKVNGHKITRSEVNKYYETQTAGSPQRPTGTEADMLRLNILIELINRQIVLQRAEKLGVVASDDDIDRKVTETKQPYTEEQFKQRLSEQSMTEADLRDLYRYQITLDKLMNKEIVSKISITDADVTSYYNGNRAEFNHVEALYHLAQMIVTPDATPVNNLKNDKARNEADAKRKIQMLANRLASGEDFATLAMNYSEDPNTAGNGGDLGLIPESRIKSEPEAYAAISRLKDGQNSGILNVVDPGNKRVAGYRIIRLLELEPAGQQQLQDPSVQQRIREKLRAQREQLMRSAYFEMMRNEAKIEDFYADNLLKQAGATPGK